MTEAHAKLAASGSAKWLSCPAALAFEALLDTPDYGNEFCWEGTAAHELLYRSLSEDQNPAGLVGQLTEVETGEGEKRKVGFTYAMAGYVEIAIEYIERLTARQSFYEERVDYSHIAPAGFGTADVLLEVNDKVSTDKKVNTLYVIDFKYGKGVKVDAFENSQGMLYALGALNSLDMLFERDIERVVIVILQPRMDNTSEFEIPVEDLKKWGEETKPKAELAHKLWGTAVSTDVLPSPEHFNPTLKGCQWCQGKKLKRCKAQAQMGYSAAVEGFDDLTAGEQADLKSIDVSSDTIKDPAFLDTSELAAIYFKMQLFVNFSNGLADEIRSRIKAGESVPGVKLIPTKDNRAWSCDNDDAIRAIRTAGLQKCHYEKVSLITPTKAEALLKEVKPKTYKRRYRKLEAAVIHRPPGKDKIVEDNQSPVDDFDNLLD